MAGWAESGERGTSQRGVVQGSPCSWQEVGSFLLLLKLRVWDFNPNNLMPRFLSCHGHRAEHRAGWQGLHSFSKPHESDESPKQMFPILSGNKIRDGRGKGCFSLLPERTLALGRNWIISGQGPQKGSTWQLG